VRRMNFGEEYIRAAAGMAAGVIYAGFLPTVWVTGDWQSELEFRAVVRQGIEEVVKGNRYCRYLTDIKIPTKGAT
jgi:hypothetical protein